MHQQAAQPFRFLRQHSRRRAVNRHGQLRLALRLVHRRVGRGIHNHRRSAARTASRIVSGLVKSTSGVSILATGPQADQLVPQLPPQLSCTAKNENSDIRHAIPSQESRHRSPPLPFEILNTIQCRALTNRGGVHPSSAPGAPSGHGDRSSSLGWWSMGGRHKGKPSAIGSFHLPFCFLSESSVKAAAPYRVLPVRPSAESIPIDLLPDASTSLSFSLFVRCDKTPPSACAARLPASRPAAA